MSAGVLSRIESQLDTLERLIANEAELGVQVPSVSGWSISQQVDHTTQVISRIAASLLQKTPVSGGGATLRGRFVLFVGRIPRGSARSPKGVMPTGAGADELRSLLSHARTQLDALGADTQFLGEQRPYFPHPSLGGFTPKQALRFIEVHTEHHLRIIKDILRAARERS